MVTACGNMPLSFMQMLAACVVKDPTTNEVLGINTMVVPADQCECAPARDCSIAHIDPERFVVENAFGLDACGRLAIKFVGCELP